MNTSTSHSIVLRIAAVGCLLCGVRVYAVSITNSDFDTDLSSWVSRGDVSHSPGAGVSGYVTLAEPGQASVTMLSQPFDLPAVPQFLTFRYRFLSGASFAKPVLVRAVSRKTHPTAFGGLVADIDLLAGQTECRAADTTIGSGLTTELLILATFDRPIALAGLPEGDIVVLSGSGTITDVTVDFATLTISITGVHHVDEIDLAFPGVVDAVFGTVQIPPSSDPAGGVVRQHLGGSDSVLCVVQVTGDYNNDGRLSQEDIDALSADFPSSTDVTPLNIRGDWDLNGSIESDIVAPGSDTADVTAAGLIGGASAYCPDVVVPQSAEGALPDPTLPPDSFSAYLVQQAVDDRPIGLDLSQPDSSLTTAFLYEDSNGVRLKDDKVTISPAPDGSGMLEVTLDLTGVDGNQPVRIAFSLAGADNGVTSNVWLDSVYDACPPASSGWCCNPATGVLTLMDDGDPCTADGCNPTDGTVEHLLDPQALSQSPNIDCPPDTYTDWRRPSDPAVTGWATTNDVCGDPVITYNDIDGYDPNRSYICGSVINRVWTVTLDDTGASSSCVQFISAMNSNAPFYQCLGNQIVDYFTMPSGAVIPLDTQIHVDCEPESYDGSKCSCTLLDAVAECYKSVVDGTYVDPLNGQQMNSCINEILKDLAGDSDLSDGVKSELTVEYKAEMAKCLSESLHRLYYWITGQDVYIATYALTCSLNPTTPGPFGFESSHFTSCDGGPTGTEPCSVNSDCADDFDPATHHCCVIPGGHNFGWCETQSASCP